MAGIGADAEHAADVIEDDRGVGKGAGEVDRVRQLRMVLPGFEAEAERGELGKALAEFGVAHEMRRHRRAWRISGSHRCASHDTPWRMPRKRPPPTLISASSTSRTRAPIVKSAWPTIASATRHGP